MIVEKTPGALNFYLCYLFASTGNLEIEMGNGSVQIGEYPDIALVSKYSYWQTNLGRGQYMAGKGPTLTFHKGIHGQRWLLHILSKLSSGMSDI